MENQTKIGKTALMRPVVIKVLLICGILSSLLYVGVDIVASMQWEGYSYTSQAFSELTAIEAPTRPLMLYALAIPYSLLVLAFGVGVWASAGRNRALRIIAGLLVAYTVAGIMGGIIFPMHSRGTSETMTLTDTMHVIFTSVGILFMLLFIGFGAAAFGKRFRLYSIGTILLIVLGGAYAYWAAFSQMTAQLPTPGMGITERINIYATLLWMLMLAIVLLRAGKKSGLERTPPFRGPNGEIIAGSIAEINYLCLGGVDQWVMIRGENISNPPLIVLHGGPGFSDTTFLRYHNASLEKNFTIVYWDQRGTGKSFNPKIPKSSMTVEQFISDLDELVDVVRKRLGKDKVVILGHSWGSTLGVLYSARFPEKVATYVGTAQVGDSAAAESASYAYALATAQRLNDQKALKELRAIGAPPHTADNLFKERTLVQRLDGQLKPKELWKMVKMIFSAPESSIFELPSVIRGFKFTIDAMWDEASKINLLEAAPVLKMPVFILLGQRDHWIPAEASEAYFNTLTAPSKKLISFEKSGHEQFVDEPEKFNKVMTELVRPTAV